MAEDAQAEIVRFLGDPSNWGDEGPTLPPIRTHGAYVFRGARRALKLKRAVRFDYMDFSSLERRRHFCEEEVRLNRRSAPDLYLRAEPVTRQEDGRLALGGAGDAMDWVVEMRRFDETMVLDEIARREGRIRTALLERLADRVHAFHAVCEKRQDRGGADIFRDIVEVSQRQCARFAGSILDPAKVAALGRGQLRALERNGALMEQRRAQGFVRQGHGDLHLGNICLMEGEPVLFDCIEFNEDFSVTDVLYDLAFLIMDLCERGQADGASLVLSRYMVHERQMDGLALLALFLANRASIRAHVSCSMAEVAATPDEAERLRRRAAHYVELGLAFLAEEPPRLLAVGGLSGSGKTTLARALAPLVGPPPGAFLLRSDELRKAMLGLELNRPAPPDAYGTATGEAVYAELRRRAGQALAAGRAVMVDAVHARPNERAALAQVAAERGLRFDGFWLEAAPAVMEKRIAARRGDASDATVAILRRQLTLDPGRIDWTRLAAGADTEELVRQALRHLALAGQSIILNSRDSTPPTQGGG
ncbi:MAG: AAA family ATPase [Alphaproteobacteria bacterium]|nr:AAA family ATPase [Alphaproteobacteria bacterium]